MASTMESQSSQQYVDFDEYIDFQLEKTRGNIKSTDILTAFAFVAVFVLAYLALFVVSDHWLFADGVGQTARYVCFFGVLGLSLGWLAWQVFWPSLREVNLLFAANVIERSQPEMKGTLLNLIDARTADQNVSPEILSAMEKQTAVAMVDTNVDEAVDRRALMWACYAVLGLVVFFCLYSIFTPKSIASSVKRALNPLAQVVPPQIVVTPGDHEVVIGTRLEVLADFPDEEPETAVLVYSTANREFVDEKLSMKKVPDMPRRFRAEIIGINGEGIQQDLIYHIEAGETRSQDYTITVFQSPSAEVVELNYTYPEYMEKQPVTRSIGGIDDYEGVTVQVLAESNMPLKSAVITFHDDRGTSYRAEAVSMKSINPERTRFEGGAWKLAIDPKTGLYPQFYTIECKNSQDEKDPTPTRWPIRIQPDRRPEVQIVNPTQRELERPANAILPLTAAAKDDFKIQSLTLWKQLNNEQPLPQKVLFQGGEKSLSVDSNWRLNEGWTLKTGDVISYWVEAADNRTPESRKKNTDKYTILIQPEKPEEEIQKELEAERKRQQEPPQNQNDAKKNPNDKPQDQKQDPANNTGEEKSKPEDQPMPKQGDPQQTQDGKTGETQGAEGSETQEGKPGESSSNQNGTGENAKPSKPTETDGSEDGKALESLHRHLNENKKPEEANNPKPDPNNPPNDQKPNDKKDNSTQKPDSENPMQTKPEPKPGETPKPEPMGNNPKPGEQGDPQKPEEAKPPKMEDDPANTDAKKPESSNNPKDKTNTQNPETTPEKTPMPNGTEKGKTPEDKKPEETGGPNDPKNPKPGENTPPGETEKPTGNNPKPKDPMNPENPGGADQNPGEGTPSKSDKPAPNQTGEGNTGENTKPREDGGPGQETKKPIDGMETPSKPDDKAEKRPATGTEKGMGTAEDDPNAKAKKAENKIERHDPEKPTETRNREGDPKNPGEKKTPGNPNPTDPKNPMTKPGDENKNPDDRPKPATDAKPNTKPATPKERPNVGEDDLKNKNRPKNQEAKKPNGGDSGTSKQNTEGTPGGNEKGPGDDTKNPGNATPSEKPQPGKPSQEAGEGTNTRPTERTEEGTPKAGKPPQEGATKPEPGEPGDGNRSQDGPQDRTNNHAGPPKFGENNPDNKPPTIEEVEAAEEANLEYGREASDLTLKQLEKEIQRGEVNEEWLKEMGWDKADAKQFLDRMKDRLNSQSQNTPEELAKNRQTNEWLKRLSQPKTKTTTRTGDTVQKGPPRELINTQNSKAPPELRGLFEDYQRRISERQE